MAKKESSTFPLQPKFAVAIQHLIIVLYKWKYKVEQAFSKGAHFDVLIILIVD